MKINRDVLLDNLPFLLLAAADCLLAGSIILQGLTSYAIAAGIWIALIHVGVAVVVLYQRRKARKKADRELCPHFNVDHKGQCNLLVEPSKCLEYCRTLKVIKR